MTAFQFRPFRVFAPGTGPTLRAPACGIIGVRAFALFALSRQNTGTHGSWLRGSPAPVGADAKAEGGEGQGDDDQPEDPPRLLLRELDAAILQRARLDRDQLFFLGEPVERAEEEVAVAAGIIVEE